MATARITPRYGQARDELAREIRKRRQDCLHHETARQLLAYDQPGHTTVVGIDAEAANQRLENLDDLEQQRQQKQQEFENAYSELDG